MEGKLSMARNVFSSVLSRRKHRRHIALSYAASCFKFSLAIAVTLTFLVHILALPDSSSYFSYWAESNTGDYTFISSMMEAVDILEDDEEIVLEDEIVVEEDLETSSENTLPEDDDLTGFDSEETDILEDEEPTQSEEEIAAGEEPEIPAENLENDPAAETENN
jgi:hypothetical protein